MKPCRIVLILLAVALIGVTAGCGSNNDNGSSGNSSKKSLTIGAQGTFNIATLWVAKDQGFLAKHGISDVKATNFTDLPAMTAAISRGQIDMGFQAPTLLQGFNTQSKASKLKFFAPGVKTSNGFLAKTGSGIPVTGSDNDWQPTVRAWEGKTIGVPALGGLIEAYVRYLGKEAGLDPKKMTVVAVGLGPAALAAMKAGKVDVLAGDAVTTETIRDSGIGEAVLDMVHNQGPRIFNNTMSAGYFAPEARIAKDRQTYSALAAALADAQKWMLDPANSAKLQQILVKDAQLPAPLAKSVVEKELTVFDVSLSDQTMQRTIDALSTVGALPGSEPTVGDLVDKG
jgi:ABC-type nitrate/sulfonate/bicarbonate transport system substrate-binding protein